MKFISQWKSSLVQLKFYKYFRLWVILLGGLIAALNVSAFSEPIDFALELHILQELTEREGAIRVELEKTEDEEDQYGEDKFWEFRRDGSIHTYDAHGHHTGQIL